jgi:hypothetical protein
MLGTVVGLLAPGKQAQKAYRRSRFSLGNPPKTPFSPVILT